MASRKLMLQLDGWPDGHCPDKKPRPHTPGGRTLAKKGIAGRMAIKVKQHGTASCAIKNHIRQRKAAYNASKH